MLKILKKELNKINIIEDLEAKILKHLISMRSDFLHPFVGLKLRSYKRTLDFIESKMSDAIICNNRKEIFNYALRNIDPQKGIIAEFGVKSGKTINDLANKPALKNQIIYGFDSFVGLPEDWGGTRAKKGQLSNNGKLPKTSKNIKLISGWFADTLPVFIKDHSENAILLHIDCDLYSSTKTILECFAEKIIAGTIIIFDEFFNYPNWENHEYKAWQEFTDKYNISYKYIAYAHTQVIVQII
jgi:hypothetical protein